MCCPGLRGVRLNLTAGGVTRAVLRSTLVLTRRPEGWRIAQHHFSSTPSEPPIPLGNEVGDLSGLVNPDTVARLGACVAREETP